MIFIVIAILDLHKSMMDLRIWGWNYKNINGEKKTPVENVYLLA